MKNSPRFPSGPFCSLSGRCGEGGGWRTAGHSLGKAKIRECLPGMDVICKSLRESSLSAFPAQKLRFNNASSIPFRTFPTKSPHLRNWHFLAKKRALFLKNNLVNSLYKLTALRISHCAAFLASLEIICPVLPGTDLGQFWLLHQRKTIVECVLFCYFGVVQPENNEERTVFLWLCSLSYW